MVKSYQFKDSTANNRFTSSNGTLLTAVKFNTDVVIKSLYWYRGVSGAVTVAPRLYANDGTLIGKGADVVEATNVLGWYKLDLEKPVALKRETEYLYGFYFSSGGSLVGYLSGRTSPTTFELGDGVSATFTRGANTLTGDTFIEVLSSSIRVSSGFDIDVNANKFLILSEKNEIMSLSIPKYIDAIPTMTSDTSPSGIASASSVFTIDYQAWKAFNGTAINNVDTWASLDNQSENWLQYEFPNEITIGKYSIQGYNLSGYELYNPQGWRFEGYNEKTSSWDTLDNQTNQSFTVNQIREYIVKIPKRYKKYRLFVTAVNGMTRVCVAELKMFELLTNDTLKILQTPSEQNFINHGMDKSTELDLSAEMTNKIFVEQSSTSLGNGKVFRKSIDTTKTPIKKVSIK